MKRQLMFGAMLSAVLVAGAAAQQPAQTTPQSQGEKDKTVTLVGCLQPADKGGPPTGTTGDTTSRQQSNREEHYVLANATMSSASSASGTSGTATGARTGGTGTTGATGSMSGAKSYRLIATDSQDLDRLVNSRVEVTGTIVGENRASGAAGSGTGTGTAPKETKPGQSEQASMPSVRVTSARQVASSCSGGENR